MKPKKGRSNYSARHKEELNNKKSESLSETIAGESLSAKIKCHLNEEWRWAWVKVAQRKKRQLDEKLSANC